VVRVPDTPSSSGDAASCEVSELGTCVQLTVRGELDAAALAALNETTRRIDLSPGRVVVLDLCGASGIDTDVVHFVQGLHGRAGAQGSSLVVVLRPHSRELFQHAEADGVTVVDDAGDAPS
jgi:anti-anti-sigma regulatory factor